MNTIDRLKTSLAEAGWRFGKAYKDTGVEWYAYKQMLDAAECAQNEKPAQLILVPWDLEGFGESVTLSISGAVDNDQWVEFEAYNIPYEDVMKKMKRTSDMLVAAWNTAKEAYNK